VEVLSPCPTGWKMTPPDAKNWVDEVMMKYFEINTFKNKNGTAESKGATAKAKSPAIEKQKLLELLGDTQTEGGSFARPATDPKFMNPRIKVAGFGGQGILLLGQLMAQSAMLSNYHSTWLPSYGPEMRGGTANCHVIISERRIGAPLVAECDVLIAMNLPSLDKFEDSVKPGGVIFVNSSLIEREVKRDDVQVVRVPVTEIADSLKEPRVANVVMLGAYIGYTRLLSVESVHAAAARVVKRKEFMEINQAALKRGMEHVQQLVENDEVDV